MTCSVASERRATGSSGPGVSRAYLRDGASPTDPLLKDGAATYTPGDSVRAGGTTSFLSAGLKSADAQSSSSQTLSETRVYDAFGNVASSSGSWSGVFAYGGVYGYQEDATGLRLLGHRWYDPSTGRFLTRDPIEDGRNWYAYVENDPVNAADPSGLTKWWCFLGGQYTNNDDIPHVVIEEGKEGYSRRMIVPPGYSTPHDFDADYIFDRTRGWRHIVGFGVSALYASGHDREGNVTGPTRPFDKSDYAAVQAAFAVEMTSDRPEPPPPPRPPGSDWGGVAYENRPGVNRGSSNNPIYV